MEILKQQTRLYSEEKQFLSIIGDNLYCARKSKKLTQRGVANKIDTTQPTYHKIEKGERDPGLVILRRLGNLFERNISELIGEDLNGGDEMLLHDQTHALLHTWAAMSTEQRKMFLLIGKGIIADKAAPGTTN